MSKKRLAILHSPIHAKLEHPEVVGTIGLILLAIAIFQIVGYIYLWMVSFSGVPENGEIVIHTTPTRYTVIQVYLVIGLLFAVATGIASMNYDIKKKSK